MHIEKPKANRFRTLVPKPPPPTKSQSRISIPPSRGECNRDSTVISNEALSINSKQRGHSMSRQHYQLPLKRFIKQGRMRTISALQQTRQERGRGQLYKPEIEDLKYEGQKKRSWKRQKQIDTKQKQLKKWNKMVGLVEQFKSKALRIMNMDQDMYYKQYPQQQPEEQLENSVEEYQQLKNQTKQRAAKLISIYLQRYLSELKADVFRLFRQYKAQEEEEYLISTLPICPPSGQARDSRQGRNLLNVRKFLDSK